jgi:toxin ParE1/3/4
LYIDTLAVAFQALAEAPNSAPSCDQIRAGYRRRYIERHVIYYQVAAYGVAVLRVLHDRMDAPRHLRNT